VGAVVEGGLAAAWGTQKISQGAVHGFAKIQKFNKDKMNQFVAFARTASKTASMSESAKSVLDALYDLVHSRIPQQESDYDEEWQSRFEGAVQATASADLQLRLNEHNLELTKEPRQLDFRCTPVRIDGPDGTPGISVPNLTKPNSGYAYRVVSFPFRSNPQRLLCFDVEDLEAYVLRYVRDELKLLSLATSIHKVANSPSVLGRIPNPLAASKDAQRRVKRYGSKFRKAALRVPDADPADSDAP